ncbi:magnesium transporter CorA family protein [Teredinibacter haidensis]|uniref:magnesium transporter CorA family protein n=1 Tax=Teredinibacter haidensis TaxID=2731755 RepID=UPI000948E4A7|nr:magnesium transporter CorA family protein [Teredinibacter haidensis]
MHSAYLFNKTGVVPIDYSRVRDEWSRDCGATLWVDINVDQHEEVISVLNDFDIHSLAVEDTLRKRHPPKIEFFDDYAFILYRGISSVAGNLEFGHMQISLFIGRNYLITLHRGKSLGVAEVMSIVDDPERLKKHKKFNMDSGDDLLPMHIALNILHASSSVYLDNVLEFESRLSDLEDEMQAHGDDVLLSELTLYKARLLKLRRVFDYHKGITEALGVETENVCSVSFQAFHHEINDLHERFVRLYTLVQMHYDICGDLIEGYLSIASHRLNVTMRVLTVITAVFIPLGFLAGLYGMNFEYIPELGYRYSYFVLLGVMAFLAATLLLFFRRKSWI